MVPEPVVPDPVVAVAVEPEFEADVLSVAEEPVTLAVAVVAVSRLLSVATSSKRMVKSPRLGHLISPRFIRPSNISGNDHATEARSNRLVSRLAKERILSVKLIAPSRDRRRRGGESNQDSQIDEVVESNSNKSAIEISRLDCNFLLSPELGNLNRIDGVKQGSCKSGLRLSRAAETNKGAGTWI